MQAILTLPFGLQAAQLAVAGNTRGDIRDMQAHWRQFLPAGFAPPEPADLLSRDEKEWKALLGKDRFAILREEATERAFTSPLNDEKRHGVFVCAGCELPLFTSEMKYDSGTGWPSFFTTIPDSTGTKKDFKLIWPRTEYHCVRCGGHQGHVFDDGPAPTRQRWCNNGLAIRFMPSASPQGD